jgi:hypothetical protein
MTSTAWSRGGCYCRSSDCVLAVSSCSDHRHQSLIWPCQAALVRRVRSRWFVSVRAASSCQAALIRVRPRCSCFVVPWLRFQVLGSLQLTVTAPDCPAVQSSLVNLTSYALGRFTTIDWLTVLAFTCLMVNMPIRTAEWLGTNSVLWLIVPKLIKLQSLLTENMFFFVIRYHQAYVYMFYSSMFDMFLYCSLLIFTAWCYFYFSQVHILKSSHPKS